MFEKFSSGNEARSSEDNLKSAWIESMRSRDPSRINRAFAALLKPVAQAIVQTPDSDATWIQNGAVRTEQALRAFCQDADRVSSTIHLAEAQHFALPDTSFEIARELEQARQVAMRLVWAQTHQDKHLVQEWIRLRSSLLNQLRDIHAEQRRQQVETITRQGKQSLKPLLLSTALSLGMGAGVQVNPLERQPDAPHTIQLSPREQQRQDDPQYRQLRARIEHRGRPSATEQQEITASLGREARGQRIEANIENSPEGGVFGRIELYPNNHIQDALWVTQYEQRIHGRFTTAGLSDFYDINSGGPVAARVHLRPRSFSEGEWVTLPAPAGYAVIPTSVRIMTAQGTTDSIAAIDPETNAFQAHRATHASVTYQITELEQSPQTDRADANEQATYSPETEAQIHRFRSSRLSPEDMARELAHDKIYITSNELADIYHAMGISMPLIAEEVGALDCDTVSQYVAGVLNDAGVEAGVAGGYVANGAALEARAHGKLLVRDVFGRYKTIETTGLMSNAIPARKDVIFRPTDYASLARLALSVSASANPTETRARLREFHDQLFRILADPWYDQFNAARAPQELMQNTFLNSVYAFFDLDTRIDPYTHERRDERRITEFKAQTGTLAFLYLLTAYVPLMLIADKKGRKQRDIAHAQREELLKKIVESTKVSQEKLSVNASSEASTARVLQEAINHEGDWFLRESLKGIDATQLSTEKKQMLAALLLFVKALDEAKGNGIWDNLAYWTREADLSSHWQRLLSRLETDGLSRDALFDQLRQRGKDETKEAGWKEHRKDEANHLIAVGSEQAKQLRLTERGQRAQTPEETLKRALRELGIESSSSIKIEAPSQQIKPGRNEIASTRAYAPGDPLRAVDWKNYARDPRRRPQLVMTAEERSLEQEVPSYHVAIDLTNVSQGDMERLTAMILYANQRPQLLHFKSLTGYAYGKPCLTRSEREIAQIIARVQDGDRPSELRRLLMDLQSAAMEQHLFSPMHAYSDTSNRYWQEHRHPLFDPLFSQTLDLSSTSKDGPVITLGSNSQATRFRGYQYEQILLQRLQKERDTTKSSFPKWMQTILASIQHTPRMEG